MPKNLSEESSVKSKSWFSNWDEMDYLKAGAVSAFAIMGAGLAFSRYRVSRPSQYLVRTGLGIDGLSITKKAVQWPGQKYAFIDMTPQTFDITVSAMSKERIPFVMPGVWTIGPRDDIAALKIYASLLMENGNIEHTVNGVIQGETRVLTANMTLDDLFSNREHFRNEIEEKINKIIGELGLKAYNANIAELRDLDKNNRYFEEQKLRALERVNQEARVAVASATKDGEIGEKAERTETRKQVSELERNATVVENENLRGIEESKKNLEVAKAEFDRELKVARAISAAQAESKNLELQKEIEEKRNLQLTAELRAKNFTAAAINAEVTIKQAEAKASAIVIEADAQLQAKIKLAEGDLQVKLKEAEGIKAIRKAEAEGLSDLLFAAQGDITGLVQYSLVQKEMLPKLVAEQAKGLQGLNPKINIWNTPKPENNSVGNALGNFLQTSLPWFSQIKDQTGRDFLTAAGIPENKGPDTEPEIPNNSAPKPK